MISKNKVLMIAVIIALLICCTMEQRGRSRSRSSSGSRSRSSFSGFGRRSSSRRGFWSSSENCTTINGTTTCTQPESSGGDWITYTTLIIGGIVWLWSHFGDTIKNAIQLNDKTKPKNDRKVEESMMDFEGRMESYPSCIEENIRQQMVDTFVSRRYKMVIKVKNLSDLFNCQLRVTDLKKIHDSKFEIQMKGSDEVGTSQLKGLLVYKDAGMAIKLSKVYDNRAQASQTGDYDTLLYQGQGNPDHFSGSWAFHGFENSAEYSGSWEMSPI